MTPQLRRASPRKLREGDTSSGLASKTHVRDPTAIDHGELSGLGSAAEFPFDHDAVYLNKENTTEYTPDADYEPATKKYVDDNAAIPAITDDIFALGTGSSIEDSGLEQISVSSLNLRLGPSATTSKLTFRTQGGGGDDASIVFQPAGGDSVTRFLDKALELAEENASAALELRFWDEVVGVNSRYVGFKAPPDVVDNVIWTLPDDDGSADQVLSTDGAGVLSWVDQTGGGSGDTWKTLDSDSGFNLVAVGEDTLILAGGVGIVTVNSTAPDTVTFNLDITELTAQTFAEGGWHLLLHDGAHKKITFANFESSLTHDNLAFVSSDEHVDHTAVSVTAGVGLAGGGTIDSTVTLDLDISALTEETGIDPAADWLAFEDVTGGDQRKIHPDDLAAALGLVNTANLATDNAVIRWDDVGGNIDESGVLIDDSDAVTGITQLDVDNVRINGQAVVASSGQLEIGDSDTDIEIGSATLSVMRPHTTLKVDLGTSAKKFNALYLDSVGSAVTFDDTATFAKSVTINETATALTVETVTRLNNDIVIGEGTEQTISGGNLATGGQAYIVVDTQSEAASDDLDDINENSQPGQVIFLEQADAARVVTLTENGTPGEGAIIIPGASTLDIGTRIIMLMGNQDGDWVVIGGGGL